ncbi:hypothetical protein DPMN_059470 [Dreissena polymorpha]|uniref:Uncharacterized protein n=1 Tax=Dreissena polymorpha TaxID=45954 RepID=A0A9D4C3J5_DREPO|nr:hypothetical protein DPMN_059470 [Dreissena polymorpha]
MGPKSRLVRDSHTVASSNHLLLNDVCKPQTSITADYMMCILSDASFAMLLSCSFFDNFLSA